MGHDETRNPHRAIGNPQTESKPRPLTRSLPLHKTIVDWTLNFLSNANNETIGACLLALGATTYLILGRLGLILIGLVGGIVLHATWESNVYDGALSEEEVGRKKEVGIEVSRRILDWKKTRNRKWTEPAALPHEDQKGLDFSDFPVETEHALNTFVDAVLRDYVKWWYHPILPTDESFPIACRRVFTGSMLSISSHISQKRVPELFMDFVTNSSAILIVLLNELSTVLSISSNSPPAQSVETYVKLKPDSSLANILDQKQQKNKLLMIADDVLETHLDLNAYNCSPVRVFLREVLANLIFESTLRKCCKSEWINEWIIYILEDVPSASDTNVDVEKADRGASSTTTTSVESDVPSSKADENRTTRPEINHKRNISRAEEAMEEAMREAERLTRLMAEEDRKLGKETEITSDAVNDDASDSTNALDIPTPASSQSDLPAHAPSTSNGPQASIDPKSFTEDTSPNVDATTHIETLPVQADGDLIKNSSTLNTLAEPAPPLGSRRGSHQEALTLYRASVSVFETSDPSDRRPLRSRPTEHYMIQVEPVSTSFRGVRGYMVSREYADFETLHEVLRRISMVSGTKAFTEAHTQLPAWRGQTKIQLASELERYLVDAIQYEALAESEGMKRFLDKDQAGGRSPVNKNNFWAGPAALETVGKGMFDVLSKAPKGVAAGGKTVIGGVTSVLGASTNAAKKVVAAPAPRSQSTQRPGPELPRDSLSLPSSRNGTAVQALPRSRSPASVSSLEPRPSAELQRRPSTHDFMLRQHLSTDSKKSTQDVLGGESQDGFSRSRTTSPPDTPQIKLPPPPLEIPGDSVSSSGRSPSTLHQETFMQSSVDGTSFFDISPRDSTDTEAWKTEAKSVVDGSKLSDQETQVTIELFFAVINELYTLSSAWNIRRTLLNAAKAYLLRPGYPQLGKIREFLQESVLDANSSDIGIAGHILKIRTNGLPTEEELKHRPQERTPEQKEALRREARRLLVERGMPQALTSVMGTAASGEALGKVFDFLQVEEVARGLMFGLLLQAVRAIMQ